MRRLEHVRIALKQVEFHLTPTMSRALLPFTRLQDPYRDAERSAGFIFIHVPKAAGTSIARALFDDKSRHVPLARYYAFDRALAERCFKFAFVRNPWDRLQSAHAYLAKRIGADPRWPDHRWATHYLADFPDFESFVDQMRRSAPYRKAIRRYIHFRDQLDWVTVHGRRGVAVDFIGRFEHMQEDFAKICDRLGRNLVLPHERAGQACGYQGLYSDAARDFVGELYARDIDAFGYSFGQAGPACGID